MKYCQKCGASISDDASFCPNCGTNTNTTSNVSPNANTNYANNRICPDSHLALAIISTILCCLPLGIVAIIKSTNVSKEFQMGNYEAAQQASNDAKKWSIIAMVCGAVGVILYFIFMLIGVAALDY